MKSALLTKFGVCIVLMLPLTASAQSTGDSGLGKSTITCIDKDGDQYGVGPGCLGPDADDNDASVHATADVLAKYGSIQAFLLHLGYAPTRTWYMSPSGNDATGAVNDPNHPYITFAAIAASLAPGDVVLFRAGTYHEQLSPIESGSAGKPIVLMAYPGERPTIDFSGQGSGGLTMVNISWNTIDGLRLLNSASSGGWGIKAGTWYSPGTTGPSLSHDITIRNTEVLQAYWGLIMMNGLLNVTIEDSAIHDSTTEHNIYLGSRDVVSSNVSVLRNLIFNSAGAGNGFQFNGRVTNLIIDSNMIYSNMLSGISLLEGVSSSVIRNNVIFNNARNAIIIFNYDGSCSTDGLICPYDQTNNLIENNTLYSSGYDRTGAQSAQAAILVSNGSTGQIGNLGGNVFRNNIIIGTGVGGHYPAVVFTDTGKPYLSTSTFDHNLFWETDGATDNAVIGYGIAGSWGYAGYTCTQATSLTILTGCINSDPKLTAVNASYYATPSSFNFIPLSGSPTIGAGTATAAPATDITGVARPTPPSIGAYEYGQSVPAAALTITSPRAGSVVSGAVTVSASASAGISGVQFQLDGQSLGAQVTAAGAVFTSLWDTTKATNGSHTLAVVGTGIIGNTISSSITVSVSNTVGPVVSGIAPASINSSGATITWATTTPSDSQVAYGTTTAYGSTSALASSLVTTHSVILSGLVAATVYHYQVLSKDAQGNLTQSGDMMFTTTTATSPSNSSIAVPLNSWTMVATHGIPGEAVGWEKLIYSPAAKRAVMLGNFHQMSTEPNTSLIGYSFEANRWDLMNMGGLFHEEDMPDAGHSAGMFVYDPNLNTFIYYCCASGAMEPENPWHMWWFDPIGNVGRDKHTAPKPGMPMEGGAAFDVAHNVFVFFDGGEGTWLYDPAANVWTQQTPKGTPPPVGLELAMMTYSTKDQKVYLFGGRYGYGSTAIFYNDIYTYDVGTNTWTLLAPAGTRPPGREKGGFAYDSTNNIFLLYGGHNDSGVTNPPFNDTWVYDPAANVWKQLSPAQSPPGTDAPFERLAYDPDHNVFVMVLEGPNGYADGNWLYYSMQTWLFRYAGTGPLAGTSQLSVQPSNGSINHDVNGWAKEPSLAVSGNTAYAAWVETGKSFDGSDAAWSHVYVSEFMAGKWTPLGGSFNSVNSELTTTSGHSESHSPSMAVIGGTPWVSYYQATTDNSNPIPSQVYAKSWNGSAWAGGPIGLVDNATRVYQGRSELTGVNGVPYIAFLEVDKNVWPQEAFAYVKQWNGTQWVVQGTGPLNRNIGTFAATPLSFADSISIASDGTNPYVAWTEYTSDTGEANQTSPQVYVAHWNGAQWVAVGGSLNMNPGNWAYDAAITYFNGRPYVAWTERTQSGNAQVFVKAFDGTNWIPVGSGTLNRDSNSGWAFRPSLASDSSNLYLGWTEQQALGQPAQAYVSQWNGSSWTQIAGSLNSDSTAGSSQRASVAVLNGSPVAAWGEVRLGSMRQVFVKQWSGSAWGLTTGAPAPPPSCDINGDGVVNSADVQIAINQALGISACSSASLQQNGQCTIVDVQRVVIASGGGSCLVGQ